MCCQEVGIYDAVEPEDTPVYAENVYNEGSIVTVQTVKMNPPRQG